MRIDLYYFVSYILINCVFPIEIHEVRASTGGKDLRFTMDGLSNLKNRKMRDKNDVVYP